MPQIPHILYFDCFYRAKTPVKFIIVVWFMFKFFPIGGQTSVRSEKHEIVRKHKQSQTNTNKPPGLISDKPSEQKKNTIDS